MLATLRPVGALLAGTVTLLLGVGLLNTLVPLRAQELGFSVTLIGALTSVYYLGYLAGTWLLPQLVHRIGHIRAFAFCTALVAAVVLVQALGSSPALWLALRAVQGLALVGLYAIIESWLNVAAEPQHRNRVFSIYMMLNLGALALGQQLLRIGGEAGVLFSVVAILVCLATLPVATTRQDQPQAQAVPRLALARLYRRVPTALGAALLSGLTLGALYGLLPLFAADAGFSVPAVATYMSLAIAGGVLLQWPLGRFSDRVDRRLALAVVGLAAAAAAAANLLPGVDTAAAMALIFVFGGLSFAVYPIAVAHLVDWLPREDLLAASGAVLLVYGAGSAIGPLLAGALMHAAGPQMLFAWFCALNLLLAVSAFHRYRVRWRAPVDEDHFVPMLRTTPAVLELHPETGAPTPAAEG